MSTLQIILLNLAAVCCAYWIAYSLVWQTVRQEARYDLRYQQHPWTGARRWVGHELARFTDLEDRWLSGGTFYTPAEREERARQQEQQRQKASDLAASLMPRRPAATARCVTCRAEFTDGELANLTHCPHCGEEGMPMHTAADVTIRINWHELRVLTIWADNWVRAQCPASSGPYLRGILRALDAQRPAGEAALTIEDELREVADALGRTVTQDGGTFTLAPKTKH